MSAYTCTTEGCPGREWPGCCPNCLYVKALEERERDAMAVLRGAWDSANGFPASEDDAAPAPAADGPPDLLTRAVALCERLDVQTIPVTLTLPQVRRLAALRTAAQEAHDEMHRAAAKLDRLHRYLVKHGADSSAFSALAGLSESLTVTEIRVATALHTGKEAAP